MASMPFVEDRPAVEQPLFIEAARAHPVSPSDDVAASEEEIPVSRSRR
jgi:hypothetical protein